ncbi:Hypothetical predicted protein [Mytilus galloprovincialis]|uniref:Uncharacterized protein n=1 Tax=Mytilus galloprovincialis TaxID=29158 RepID=A0A8B6CP46_MYTGA|nr:Hypothetical predicted protein [Mytilus galloprovincialis]
MLENQQDYRPSTVESLKQGWNTLVEEADTAASLELSTVYKIRKKLSGEHTSSSVQCKSKDGNILTSENQQLERWTEHRGDVPVNSSSGTIHRYFESIKG